MSACGESPSTDMEVGPCFARFSVIYLCLEDTVQQQQASRVHLFYCFTSFWRKYFLICFRNKLTMMWSLEPAVSIQNIARVLQFNNLSWDCIGLEWQWSLWSDPHCLMDWLHSSRQIIGRCSITVRMAEKHLRSMMYLTYHHPTWLGLLFPTMLPYHHEAEARWRHTSEVSYICGGSSTILLCLNLADEAVKLWHQVISAKLVQQ